MKKVLVGIPPGCTDGARISVSVIDERLSREVFDQDITDSGLLNSGNTIFKMNLSTIINDRLSHDRSFIFEIMDGNESLYKAMFEADHIEQAERMGEDAIHHIVLDPGVRSKVTWDTRPLSAELDKMQIAGAAFDAQSYHKVKVFTDISAKYCMDTKTGLENEINKHDLLIKSTIQELASLKVQRSVLRERLNEIQGYSPGM